MKPVSALELPDNCIRELDFVQLKTYLMLAIPQGLDQDALEKTVSDYHSIVRMINLKWAGPLNFQLKLTRSPKWNRDGSCCTMRLYCTKFLGKNNPNSCPFGITFKLQGTLWSVAEDYSIQSMCHHGHNIVRPADELMFEDQETTSQTYT